MRTLRAFALLALLLIEGSPAKAERLILALSTQEVKIASNFTGTSIVLFGAIERDAGTVSRADGYELAAVVRGPAENVVTRRKDRFLGVWINRASESFREIPSFYAVATSRPVKEIAADAVLDRLQIGIEHIRFPVELGEGSTAQSADFVAAVTRLKQQNGLYAEAIAAIQVSGTSIFQTAIAVPANVPVGQYTATVFLFSGGQLLGEAENRFRISKSGFEQAMFDFAQNQALAYGSACFVLALCIGWLAGVIFRRD